MAREWKSRQPPAQSSITEIARRYYSCAVALAKVMGVPLTETFLQEHHAAIASCFIESGRCELRLAAGVALPPLEAPVAERNGPQARPPEASNQTMAQAVGVSAMTVGRDLASVTNVAPAPSPMADSEGSTDEAATNVAPEPLPTVVPAGLPCAGQAIAALKPAHLRMVLSKVDQLAATEGRAWQLLLEALTAERAQRLAQGRRPTVAPGEAAGDGAA